MSSKCAAWREPQSGPIDRQHMKVHHVHALAQLLRVEKTPICRNDFRLPSPVPDAYAWIGAADWQVQYEAVSQRSLLWRFFAFDCLS